MALTDNLKGYWKLDEASGNSQDSSGNGEHLTNTNTATFGTGKINNGTILNGTDQCHKILDSSIASIGTGSAFSVQAWFKADTITSIHFPVSGSTANNSVGYPYCMWIEGTTVSFMTWNTTGNWLQVISSVAISTGNWYHCVLVKESNSSWKIYVNGTVTASTATRSGTLTGQTGLAVGANDGGTAGMGGYFDGMVDEVAIWDRALTSDEVTELYNSGNGLSYPFSSTSIKSFNGLAYSSVKSINGLAIASVKNKNGLA